MRTMKFKPLTLIVVLSLALGLALGCSDDDPPVGSDAPVKLDNGNNGFPDTYQGLEPISWPDFSWPDTVAPADIFPWPSDAYKGTTFGCRWDSDCFGQKCCPTPWGIKLCAPTCKW